MSARKTLDRFDVIREFRDGMICAIAVSRVKENAGEHWNAGWVAGRRAASELGNEYLRSLGLEPMALVRLATEATEKPASSGPREGEGK